MAGALEGLRVVDFGQYLAAPLTTMMLADHGAEVIRVDPPGGPLWTHHANAILHRGKRSIVLDLKAPADWQTARELVGRADIVVENFRPTVMARLGLGADAMVRSHPRLIYCSIPGFGASDPRAGRAGWEGILGAVSGFYQPKRFAHLKASPTGPEPIFNVLPLASTFAAMIATNSIVAALIARERTGRGQSIEVPLFDAMFEAFGPLVQKLPPNVTAPPRHYATDNIYRCADGRWIYIVMSTQKLWTRFGKTFMGEDWFALGLDDNRRLATEPGLADEAMRRMAALFLTRPAVEWDAAVNAAGVPLTICQTSREWIGSEQARATEAVIPLDDFEFGPTVQAGFAVALSRTPPRVRHPRHQTGEDEAAIRAELAGPPPSAPQPPSRDTKLASALDGVTVIDISQILAAPNGSRILAEFGADVIKINHPRLSVHGVLYPNSGKRTALIDVAQADGRAVLESYLPRADVFLENFTVGTAERLGIGDADVRKLNPNIIYASLNAYGYRGPRAGFRGFEAIGQAATGMASRLGGDVPKLQYLFINDHGSAQLAAMAVLLALYHRARTGEGQHVSTSLTQMGTYHQLPFMIDYEGRRFDEPSGRAAQGWNAFDRLYQASDGWFYVAAPRASDRERLLRCAGLQTVCLDENALADALAEIFQSAPLEKWAARLDEGGVAMQPIVRLEDLPSDPIVWNRKLLVVRDHPGVGPTQMAGPVPRLSATPVRLTYPAPLPGSDTAAIVRESRLAGRYDAMLRAGTVSESLPAELLALL